MKSSAFQALARDSDRQLRFGTKAKFVEIVQEVDQNESVEEEKEFVVMDKELAQEDLKLKDDQVIETVEEDQIEVVSEEYFSAPEEENGEDHLEMIDPLACDPDPEESGIEEGSTSTNGIRFECSFCSKTFHLFSLLQLHLITHESGKSSLNGNKRIKRMKRADGLKFKRSSDLNRHENGHKYPNVNKKCEKCGQEFVHEAFLKVHKSTCLSKLFKCSKCGLKFKDQGFFSYHTRNHH